MAVKFLFLLCGCEKNNATDDFTINGDYYGNLVSITYITFNGQTIIDTIEPNLQVTVNYNDFSKILSLNSGYEIFDSIYLMEDSNFVNSFISKHFSCIDTANDYRIYQMTYTKTVNQDSIYINSFLPPMGGWNTQLHYYAKK